MDEYTEVAITYQTTQNNNTVAQIDTFADGDIANSRFIYDNKVNPFKKLNFARPLFEFECHNTDDSQNNNLTDIMQTFTGDQNHFLHHYRYSYKNNSMNYPVSVIIENLFDPLIDVNKAVFIYTD